ncbi:MAG: hypothetical protein A2Y25_00055 [Candidatus Melainabacteria bacterium GWF2_37_15]|nr:MAG: hypothetical protein A2Y25_00055 [Candidatus Melainabacteria bacterium GWF2_37_15]
MKKVYLTGILFLLICVFTVKICTAQQMPTPDAKTNVNSQTSACDFRVMNRKLWSDHVTWTRMYIISALANLKDADYTSDRLLRNQQEIGNSIKPFYGEEAGNKLADLLKQHILLAVKIVDYAKAGKKAELEAEEKKWFANADDIAAFLSSANPNLSEKAVTDMLYEHLKVTKQEVVYRLNGDYKSDIEAYDIVLDDILEMSDAISEAIVKQFPNKFTT